MPKIDVTETKDAVVVTAELAGVDEGDIEIEIVGDILTLRGEKQEERADDNRNYHVIERTWGAFERSIELPPGADLTQATASFTNGLLRVVVPKTDEAKTHARRVEISSDARQGRSAGGGDWTACTWWSRSNVAWSAR